MVTSLGLRVASCGGTVSLAIGCLRHSGLLPKSRQPASWERFGEGTAPQRHRGTQRGTEKNGWLPSIFSFSAFLCAPLCLCGYEPSAEPLRGDAVVHEVQLLEKRDSSVLSFRIQALVIQLFVCLLWSMTSGSARSRYASPLASS